MRKRLVILMTLALIVAAVFLFVGLPAANLGWTPVNAQYTAACSATYQARYPSTVALYSDSGLTQFVTTLSSGVATKLLVCDETFTAQTGSLAYLKVQLADNTFFTSAANVDLVPCSFADNQP